jgi:hypothetical protein
MIKYDFIPLFRWGMGRVTLPFKQVFVVYLALVLLGVAVVWALVSVTHISIVSPVESEEDALEISKNSTFVQRELAGARKYNVEVEYLNVTQVCELKEGNESWYYEFLPNDHGVWCVRWEIYPEEGPSAVIVCITHWIDEETGEILHEGTVIAY